MGYPSGLGTFLPVPIPVALIAPGTEGYQLTVVGGVPAWAVGGEATPFSVITAGTNAATLVVGTGGSLGVSGTGTIGATSLLGSTWPTSFAVGDLVYASAANTLNKLADTETGRLLVSGGVTTAPAYSATPTLGKASTTTGSLAFAHASNAFATTLRASASTAASVTYVLPVNLGAAGSTLTDAAGDGVLSWAAASGGVTSLAGTALQITASAATGAVTLSLPSAITAPGSLAVTTTLSAATASLTGTAGTNSLAVTQAAATTGTPTGFSFTGGAHTGLALAQFADMDINCSQNVAFAAASGGTITSLGLVRFRAGGTFTTASGTQNIGRLATVVIDGAPTAGSGVSANVCALQVLAGGIHVTAGSLQTSSGVSINQADIYTPSLLTNAISALNGGATTFTHAAAANATGLAVSASASFTSAAAAQVGMSYAATFAPASGTATFTCLSILPTINQTGGANGIYTAVKVNVTETAAAAVQSLLLDMQVGGASKFGITARGHIRSTQATAPTATLTSTTLNDGAGSGATITLASGSTDACGSFTITAGNGVPTAGIAGQIVFNAAYGAAPKMVQLQAADTAGFARFMFVNGLGTASFQVNADVAFVSGSAHTYYYFVVE